jgi:hypothetical protein
MNRIDDLIKKNRDYFDQEEPFEGHFERFQKKLEAENARKVHFPYRDILKIAAVVVLVVLSALWTYDQLGPGQPDRNAYPLAEMAPEYKEAEIYYTTAINEKYNQIKSVDFDDPRQKEILLNELKEMDSIFNNLQEDLELNPDDERVINALIKHYRIKVEVMNKILDQLNEYNQKPTRNESTNI